MPSALIFTMCYWPEPTGIGPMATDLAEWLGEQGWKVTVATGFPMLPAWEVYKAYRHKVYQREIRGNTEIFRSWFYVPTRPKKGVMKAWKRILCDTSLVLTALPTLLSRRPADVIVAVGPPLQTAFVSLFLKKLWRCPVLYWMQDIVPDAALNVGMMKEGAALKLARWMERTVYEGVEQIGFISEGFRDNLLAKNVPAHKQVFLPNWADLSIFDNTPADISMRRSLGFADEDFIVMHAGSMSAKQSLENVLHAVKRLEADPSLHLVFLGGGNCEDAIKTEAERLELKRVHFLRTATGADYINKLRVADLLLINQAGAIVDALIPSKLLTYLPSERPVVAAVNALSETARFVRQAGCGLVVEPDHPERLAEGILQLQQDPVRRRKMGAAGAAFIRAHFDKKILLDRFTTILARMAPERPTGADGVTRFSEK